MGAERSIRKVPCSSRLTVSQSELFERPVSLIEVANDGIMVINSCEHLEFYTENSIVDSPTVTSLIRIVKV